MFLLSRIQRQNRAIVGIQIAHAKTFELQFITHNLNGCVFGKYSFISEFVELCLCILGTAIVTLNNGSALWTDGRYFLQADTQLDCNWILQKSGTVLSSSSSFTAAVFNASFNRIKIITVPC